MRGARGARRCKQRSGGRAPQYRRDGTTPPLATVWRRSVEGVAGASHTVAKGAAVSSRTVAEAPRYRRGPPRTAADRRGSAAVPLRFGDGTAALWRRYRRALATLWRRCAALLATPGEAHRRPPRTRPRRYRRGRDARVSPSVAKYGGNLRPRLLAVRIVSWQTYMARALHLSPPSALTVGRGGPRRSATLLAACNDKHQLGANSYYLRWRSGRGWVKPRLSRECPSPSEQRGAQRPVRERACERTLGRHVG